MTSPATITRCNVIYVSQNDISKALFVKKLTGYDKLTDSESIGF